MGILGPKETGGSVFNDQSMFGIQGYKNFSDAWWKKELNAERKEHGKSLFLIGKESFDMENTEKKEN